VFFVFLVFYGFGCVLDLILDMAETEQGVALAILRGVIDFKREPWPQISESAKSLVRRMLEPDPKNRLTAEQVLGKSVIHCTVYSLGSKMLDFVTREILL